MRVRVHLEGAAGASLVVDVPDGLTGAQLLDAAQAAADERGVPGLCHACSGYSRDYEVTLPDEWRAVEVSAVPGEPT